MWTQDRPCLLGYLSWCLVLHFDFFDLSRSMTKPTKWHVRPAKTQINLGIRMKKHWVLSYQRILWLTGRMPRLICLLFDARTAHFFLVLSSCGLFCKRRRSACFQSHAVCSFPSICFGWLGSDSGFTPSLDSFQNKAYTLFFVKTILTWNWYCSPQIFVMPFIIFLWIYWLSAYHSENHKTARAYFSKQLWLWMISLSTTDDSVIGIFPRAT